MCTSRDSRLYYRCVCDIVAALNMIQPKVSFHLGVLKEAGLIKDRRQGKWVYYSIEESEIFRRFLILSVLSSIPNDVMVEDRNRLTEFIRSKTTKVNIVRLKDKTASCRR
ncbi:MAG: metalloregulator ArsR/SmtB family transcription factor [Nitrospirota bacterium]